MPTPLVYNPNTNYTVKLYNGYAHSANTFTIPLCAPAEPTGLSANCPGTTATLSWDGAPTNQNVTSYLIKADTDSSKLLNTCASPNKPDTCISNNTPAVAPVRNSWNISTAAGNTYHWSIQAFNATGGSTVSSPAPPSFICSNAILPWIQVTGDVHSNGRINIPGGP